MKTRLTKGFRQGLSLILFAFTLNFSSCRPTVYTPIITQGSAIPIGNPVQDSPKLKSIVEPYKKQLSAEMDKVIGTSNAEIPKNKEFNQPLGNWVADIMMEVAKEKGLDADFAVIGMGGLRINLPKGPIKVSDIYELMPFENEIVVIQTDAINNLNFSLILGSKQTFGVSKESKWWYRNKGYERAVIGMDEIDFDKPYWLVTTDYLANGGDNLESFKYLPIRKNTGVKLRDAILKHIQTQTAQGKTIIAPKEERFTDNRNK